MKNTVIVDSLSVLCHLTLGLFMRVLHHFLTKASYSTKHAVPYSVIGFNKITDKLIFIKISPFLNGLVHIRSEPSIDGSFYALTDVLVSVYTHLLISK